MALLAVTGLFIGVMNDAANFLNSAIGSKAAPVRVIMAVASVGIIVGAVTSTGMMEVARSGMFDPSRFTFRDVMILYFSVMLANIILLDVYNTMGLPTSTTVALVFCLLGAALAVSTVVITSNDEISLVEIGRYINSTRAMAILAGILLSVILAFTLGTLVMYVSRAIFSFRYHTLFRRYGALWCGISFTAIVYFALFKGVAGGDERLGAVRLHRFASGPLALRALDSVQHPALLLADVRRQYPQTEYSGGNFLIGAGLRRQRPREFRGRARGGYDSYMMARASGDAAMTMGGLATDASANILLLLAAERS